MVKIHTNQHPEVIGKHVHVQYDVTNGGHTLKDWYDGVITYNCVTG